MPGFLRLVEDSHRVAIKFNHYIYRLYKLIHNLFLTDTNDP
jgi:hypothetical protein